MWTNDSKVKTRRPTQGSAFGGLNDVPPNFRSKTLASSQLGHSDTVAVLAVLPR